MAPKPAPVYRLHVTLQDVEPPVWRRIEVYRHISFDRLHLTLQVVMGWRNSHLYEFRVGATKIGDVAIAEEWGAAQGMLDVDAPLMAHVRRAGQIFRYEYDFGDSWLHKLRVERALPPEPGVRYPRCLDGAGACPPEDVGGARGYRRFLEAMADPDDAEHQMYTNWMGGEFDPDAFSVATVNDRFQKGYVWYRQQLVPPLAEGSRFTLAAARHWANVPAEEQRSLLDNVWCTQCSAATTMIDFSGRIENGNLLLDGHCLRCGAPVARLVDARR